MRTHDRTVLARGDSTAPHRRARPSTLRAPSTAPHRRPRRSTAHIGFIFSALTIPLSLASPHAVVHPTHVLTRHGQCRPSPPVLTSRRVSHPPANARTARRLRPDPTPPLEAIYHPPSPESLVCWRGECVIDDPRVRLHRDSTFFFLFDRRARSAAQHATAPSKAQFDPPLARSIDRLEDEPTPIADAPNHRAPRTTPSPRTLRFSRNEPIKSAPRPFY